MNPLALLYGKRKVSEQTIKDVELAAYILLEEIARDHIDGDGPFEMGCALLVTLQALASDRGNRKLYNMTVAGLDAWFAAGTVRVEMNRPSVQPSTQQRKALAEVLRYLPVVLRQVNIGTLSECAGAWLRHRKEWGLEGEPSRLIVRMAIGA